MGRTLASGTQQFLIEQQYFEQFRRALLRPDDLVAETGKTGSDHGGKGETSAGKASTGVRRLRRVIRVGLGHRSGGGSHFSR